MSDSSSARERIKQVIIESLHLEGTTPEMIEDEAPLFGEDGLGLDSVDALELVVALEKEYGVKIEDEDIGEEAFTSVARMAAFMEQRQAQGSAESASTG